MTFFIHSMFMAQRHLRNLSRQPWWIVISLVQPILWLLLYGQLFKRVVELPGFNASSYISFVTPGVVIMSALFAGGWNGMGVIMDMNQGVMDRLLVSPVNRAAMRIAADKVATVPVIPIAAPPAPTVTLTKTTAPQAAPPTPQAPARADPSANIAVTKTAVADIAEN